MFTKRKRYTSTDIVLVRVDGREVIKRITAVSNNNVFLQGDNTLMSTDSRTYGAIDVVQVKGKLRVRFSYVSLPFIAKRSKLHLKHR